MTQHFISVLGPYRKRIMKIFKARFCLAAASLSSKTPLPHDTQFENWLGNITHDALVQSQLFAKTSEGINSIQTGEFTRYWYVVLANSVWTFSNSVSGSTYLPYPRWANSLESSRTHAEHCLARLRMTLDCRELTAACILTP